MQYSIKCPSCGQARRISDEDLGRNLLCEFCERPFQVGTPRATAPRPKPNPNPAPVPPPARPFAARDDGDEQEHGDEGRTVRVPLWACLAGGCAAAALVLVSVVLSLRSGPDAKANANAKADVAANANANANVNVPAGDNASIDARINEDEAPSAEAAGPIAIAQRIALAAAAASSGAPAPTNANANANANANVDTSQHAPPPVTIAAPPPVPEGTVLTTAQIVARCEQSVALVKGRSSSGTGFVVRPGLIATNAHVISGEFPADLEILFPSADEDHRGPFPARFLFEDAKRDLAFLAVESGLPPLEIAPSYRFVRGEDVLVIGDPGLGDGTVLENALSRGVMSSKTVIDGMNFLQMNISINPGNSGGPVFDSRGRVIGVATLKAARAEAMGFCVPVEDLNEALGRLDARAAGASEAQLARHRARVAFRSLTLAGALYTAGMGVRIQQSTRGNVNVRANANDNASGKGEDDDGDKLARALALLEEKCFSRVGPRMPEIQADTALAPNVRGDYQNLLANYQAMRSLYATPVRSAAQYASHALNLKNRHLQLVESIARATSEEVPPELLAVLKSSPNNVNAQQVTVYVRPPTMRGPADAHARAQQRIQEMRDRMRRMHGRSRFGR